MQTDLAEQLKISSLYDVKGLIALVTGGGTGIGLMIAQALVYNGAKVYITGRRENVLQNAVKKCCSNADGGQMIALQGDASDKQDIKRVASEIQKREGRLHILVNNAGVSLDNGTKLANAPGLDKSNAEKVSNHFWQSEPELWLETYKVNVVGHYFTSLAFLALLAQGSKDKPNFNSTIINITSICGMLRSSTGGIFAYSASKAADLQLVRMMALEFAELPIRVNSIAPGLFPSEMTTGKSDENNKSTLPGGEFLPARRFGTDVDMAQAALTLVANQFMHGQFITPDGGQMAISPASA